MSYVLEEPYVAGRFAVAIISRQVAGSDAIGRHVVALHGTKVPVYAVIWDGQRVAVLDMTGAQVAPAKIVALCPAVKALLARFDDKCVL